MLVRKGKATKKFYPNVMKVRQLATCGIRVPDVEAYHLMLERYISPEYKEELLQEAILDNV